jgi:3-phosphoshikimate 1-carboxyvinyltransferase
LSPLVSRRAAGLSGDSAVPGDKSISHRALMLGALAVGETAIEGLLEGEDVLRTAAALQALGARIERSPPRRGPDANGGGGAWRVRGRGVGGLAEAAQVLDMGNSGTAARLLTGVLATHPFTSFLTGDSSLVSRPMARVIEPLQRMGASFVARAGGRLPLAVTGAEAPIPIRYALPVPSAQVKSAVLLAGLNAPGRTTVVESLPTRDHTERMLAHFGAEISCETSAGGARAVTLVGQPELAAKPLKVPGDVSSAAFPLVAALIVPDSRLILRRVGLNPLRSGLLETLAEMGAGIAVANRREECGEPLADLTVATAALRGVDVPPERAPSMIDEYPVLAVAAACADGVTRMRGLRELRVKESDRLAAVAAGLAAAGAKVEVGEDWLAVHGSGRPPAGGANVIVNLDHRIAMAFLVLGMAAREAVRIDDASPIDTSFPGFVPLMNGLGARIEAAPP